MIDNKIWNKYVNSIKNIDPILKDKIVSIFEFIEEKFPELVLEIKWNEPMFLFNNSFIIAFSVWKNHVSISPEKYAIDIYQEKLLSFNYEVTSNLFKIKKDQEVNFDLLFEIINFKMKDKANSKTFWKSNEAK